MAFVIIGWRQAAHGLHRSILGYEGIYIKDSKSAFCNEIGALDLATSAAERLAEWLPRKTSGAFVSTKRHRAF